MLRNQKRAINRRLLYSRRAVIVTIILSAALVLAAIALAAPADLDPTFDGDGKVTTPFGNFTTDESLAVAVQSDGKIIAAGYTAVGPANDDFALARYNADGSLDTTFGTGGKVVTAFGSGRDSARGVALQADGKIVAAGRAFDGLTLNFAVARYNSDGTLDTSFDSDGKVTTEFGFSSTDEGYAVAIQPNGQIVVAGYTDAVNGAWDFALARYNADGSLDTTFNGSGKVITSTFNGFDLALAVAVQRDGKIVATGWGSNNDSNRDIGLTRYNSDGTLDTSFDGDGIVTTTIFGGGDDAANAITLQPDGKIVIAGSGYNAGREYFALVRYNPDGSLDPTFDGDGKVTTSLGSSAYAVTYQQDGKIVAGGKLNGFVLARYNADGSPDTSFDSDGVVNTPFGDRASAVVIQLDGKIVATAGLSPGSGGDFSVARFVGDPRNPIDDAQFFVRQHYADFLSRVPDQGGLNYWSEQITGNSSNAPPPCAAGDRICENIRRISVSAAFFVENEFQRTGGFVVRFYRASYGTNPTFAQFNSDRALVPENAQLEQNKQNFAELFVQRPEFVAKYGQTSTCPDFTDALITTVRNSSGVDLTGRRFELIGECNIYAGDTKAQRSHVLRKLIEYPEFVQAEYNRAFVLMQYFGYLQRDPDAGGYQFWLDILNNRVPNNFRAMVCAFLTSTEYQQRFGSTITRSNSDCAVVGP
jgi:uncharacterized delta-60 repeat protein